MAPIKKPQKALKAMEKPIEKPILKLKKKNKKKNYESFSMYIYKVLRSLPKGANMGISKKSMLIMDNFVSNWLENIATEASRLVSHGKKRTLSSRDMQCAIKLMLPGELAKHANIEGIKALKAYHNTRKSM